MQLDLGALTPERFLNEYWQKKPLVIRQGLAGFSDFLSPDELAGLASEEQVESRRVFQKEGEWQAEFGPFESYDHLGKKDWSLIVQALNNWVPEVGQLISCFDFIPQWRFDDVMVSFATPGGGVGPHIDWYDVFICQGSGSRRWRVGDNGHHNELVPHSALLHVEDFEPIIDVELHTGDILYIPPGFPHDGVSLQNSMSFSMGYRTASARDMYSSLADYLIDHNLADQQIEDPGRKLCCSIGKVSREDFSSIKSQLMDVLDDQLISQMAGSVLTQSKCELDLPEEELGFDVEYLLATLQQQDLIKLGGLRCLYFEDSAKPGTFYVNGEQYGLADELAPLVALFCDQTSLSQADLAAWLGNEELQSLLLEWLNRGYWYFEE